MINIPTDFYTNTEPMAEIWSDDPDVRKAVDWFKSFMTEDEWSIRRDQAAQNLYNAATFQVTNSKGKFYSDKDIFGWYVFLAEAFLDHVHNYEPMFGSRVVPIFSSIGRNLEQIKHINGIEERVNRLISSEKSQPNGALFECLVAAAYCRQGGIVSFVPEQPGIKKTHDLDVEIKGNSFAVECKRLEISEYGENERQIMRKLWKPCNDKIVQKGFSVYGSTTFKIQIKDVPSDYLIGHLEKWLASGLQNILWEDEIGNGAIGHMDLEPLQELLKTDSVMVSGTKIQALLSGTYRRFANYIQSLNMKFAENPRFLDECDQAILFRWVSASEAAIDAKARGILRKLSDANSQLPNDQAGVIHIGFEALEDSYTEQLRYEKIIETTLNFDPKGKPLSYVYCHYLVPESPLDEAWAYDETTQWLCLDKKCPMPIEDCFLVIPEDKITRDGVHWE